MGCHITRDTPTPADIARFSVFSNEEAMAHHSFQTRDDDYPLQIFRTVSFDVHNLKRGKKH